MENKKTLLVIVSGEPTDWGQSFILLNSETGEHLASQFCSHAGFAYSDLYGSRKERIKEYSERFGEVEVKFLEDSGISEKELIAKNNEFYKDQIEAESTTA